jgi:hypothetical protein
MESAEFLHALNLLESTKITNVDDWSDSILSLLYTTAISRKNTTVWRHSIKCKKPKQDMIKTLPQLGTFLRPMPELAIPHCSPSHFGRGNELVFDESVRMSVEHKLQTNDDIHPLILKNAVNTAVRLFGSLIKVTADKVVIYSAGGKFDKHRDSIASETHVGTVVVQLPVYCKGGELMFNNADEESNQNEYFYDGRRSSSDYWDSDEEHGYGPNASYPKLHATAFYTDIEHNVAAVVDGHRVSVTFKVMKSADGPVQLSSWTIKKKSRPHLHSVSASHLGYNLEVEDGFDRHNGVDTDDDDEDLFLQPFIDSIRCKNQPIVIGCRHMIPFAALKLDGLRGIDKIVADILIAAGFTVKPVLVTVDKIDGMEDSYANYNHIYVCGVPAGIKPIFVRPSDDYEALVLESGPRYVQHIGNESGNVDALRYISAALLVTKA